MAATNIYLKTIYAIKSAITGSAKFVNGKIAIASDTLRIVFKSNGTAYETSVEGLSAKHNGITDSSLTASRLVYADSNKKLASNAALTENTLVAGGTGGAVKDSFISQSSTGVVTKNPETDGNSTVICKITETDKTCRFGCESDTATSYLDILQRGSAVAGTLIGMNNAHLSAIHAGSTSSGLLIYASGNVPIVFAQNDIERLRITATNFTVNDTGADVDSRFETDGNANMLFVDGGENKVYIGSNAKDDQGGGDGSYEALQVWGGLRVVTGNTMFYGDGDIDMLGTGAVYCDRLFTWGPNGWFYLPQTEPGSPQEGIVIYDLATHHPKYYNGTCWITI